MKQGLWITWLSFRLEFLFYWPRFHLESTVKNLESAGLFLLTPDPSSMEPREFRRIEETIGEHEWKLERDGFRFVSMQEPADLAREIYDWAKPALA
jgi:hypothetical protein